MKTESSSKGDVKTGAVFAAACMGMCFFGISMIALGAVLPSLRVKYGLSPEEVTGLVTLLPLGIFVGSMVFGPIVDRFGHKHLLIASCAAVMAGVFGTACSDSYSLLGVSILMIGLGGGILNGETNALVTEIYDGSKCASRLSLLGTFYGFGALTIPILLDRLSGHYSYESIFVGMGAVMCLCIVYCCTVRFPAPKQPQGFPLRNIGRIIGSPVLLLLGFVLFFQSGIESVTNNWTTTYLMSEGLSEATALQSLTWMLVGLTAARLVQTFLFRAMRPTAVMAASLVLTACGFVVLSVDTAPMVSYASMAVIGAGLASTFPVVFGILGDRYAAMSGTALGIALVIALCGQMLLNYTVGQVAASAGICMMPRIMAGCVVAMLVLFFVYGRFGRTKTTG